MSDSKLPTTSTGITPPSPLDGPEGAPLTQAELAHVLKMLRVDATLNELQRRAALREVRFRSADAKYRDYLIKRGTK